MQYQDAYLLNETPDMSYQTTPTSVNRKMRTKGPIIENPKELAAEFSNAVTEHSSNPMDWVARNGDESLFQTLKKIVPEVSLVFKIFQRFFRWRPFR